MRSAELNKNYFLHVSNYYKKLSLFDLKTRKNVSVDLPQLDQDSLAGPFAARLHDHKVFVMRDKCIEVRDKEDLVSNNLF